MKRWLATVNYRSSTAGYAPVDHGLEELGELQGLIERGPDWNCIDSIVIQLVCITSPGKCLEDAP
jgi:hypothetical protein